MTGPIPIPPTRVVIPQAQRLAALEMIDKALVHGHLTQGALVERFEREFVDAQISGPAQNWLGVATNSGTSALEAVMRSIGVRGESVAVPANTFFATAAAAVHAGGFPVFVDCDPETGTVRADDLAKTIAEYKPSAYVHVHIGGVVTPDMPAIVELCRREGVRLLEDCAHAHGSKLNGRPAGTFGVAGCFSFYPTKVITTAEGGLVLTDNPGLADQCRIFRDHGKYPGQAYEHVFWGSNWRMSELHAAVGIVQARGLYETIAMRRGVAEVYREEMTRLGYAVEDPPPGCDPNWYKIVFFSEDLTGQRDRFAFRVRERHRVRLSGEVFPTPLHRQPAVKALYDSRGVEPPTLPAADTFCGSHVCLPIYVGMTADEVRHVCESVHAELNDL